MVLPRLIVEIDGPETGIRIEEEAGVAGRADTSSPAAGPDLSDGRLQLR
jgi:hypothetical protein